MAGPVVGITMGDAAGIGPEVTMKALGDAEMYAICRPVVIGDARILERANHVVHGALSINRISRPADGRFELGRVDCVDLDLLPADLPFGQISAVAGDAAFRYVERAIELAQDGEIDAICTAPLNKEALHKGGHIYPGHTEILAELTGTQDFAIFGNSKPQRTVSMNPVPVPSDDTTANEADGQRRAEQIEEAEEIHRWLIFQRGLARDLQRLQRAPPRHAARRERGADRAVDAVSRRSAHGPRPALRR